MKITLEMNGGSFKKLKSKTTSAVKSVVKTVKTKRIALVDKVCN